MAEIKSDVLIYTVATALAAVREREPNFTLYVFICDKRAFSDASYSGKHLPLLLTTIVHCPLSIVN